MSTGQSSPVWPRTGKLAGRESHGLVRAGLTGLALGAAWGVAARVFMRLVTQDAPSFSWAGTLGIIGLSAVLGAGVAVAGRARAQHRSRWWWLALAPGLLLFAGQGMPFIPAFVVGGALLLRRNVLLRLIALVAVLGPGVLFWRSDRLDEVHMLSAPVRVQLADLVVLPLLCLAMALAGDRLWGRMRGAQSDSPDLARSSRRSDSSLEVPAGPA